MKLQLNGRYLVKCLQFNWNDYYSSLLEIEVVDESEKAFYIKVKNGKEFWFFKEWTVDIVEMLSTEEYQYKLYLQLKEKFEPKLNQ